VRETYQEREKELLVAAEIGKMLVEKNRTMEESLAEREAEFKRAIEEAYNYNKVRSSSAKQYHNASSRTYLLSSIVYLLSFV